MDNTSFAPGNNSINNSVPPLTPQYSSPEPKHLPKLVTWVVLIIALGFSAFAGIWYWQEQKIGDDYVPIFTPRPSTTPDPIADWKTYTNTNDVLFSIRYPINWEYSSQSQNGKIYSVSLSGTEGTVNVVWGDGFGGGYCTDPDKLGLKITPLQQNGLTGCIMTSDSGIKVGYKTWFLFKEIRSGLSVKITGNAGLPSGSQVVEQILSTFKFTDSTGLVNSFAKCIAGGYPTRPSDPKIGEESGGQRCIASDSMVFIKYDGLCAQVITKARNPKTGETGDFATPCDVPQGWEKI